VAESEQTGRCLCGAVYYRTRGKPVRVGVCLCGQCRKETGSAYSAVAVFAPGQVEVEGATAHYTARRWRRHFCPRCGTVLFIDAEGEAIFDVMIGTLDDPSAFAPTYAIFTDGAPPWVPQDPSWLSYPGERTGPARRDEP